MNTWEDLTPLALEIAADCAEDYLEARKQANADNKSLWLHAITKERSEAPTLGEQPWLPVKAANLTLQNMVRAPFSAIQAIPNPLNRLFGGPTPLASMLAGGLLGAGTGYLGGRLIESLAPEGSLRKGRLRRTTAILGGLLGATPGAFMGAVGMQAPDPHWSSRWESWIRPNQFLNGPVPVNSRTPGTYPTSMNEHIEDASGVAGVLGGMMPGAAGLPATSLLHGAGTFKESTLRRLTWDLDPELTKDADFLGEPFVPTIPVDSFNRVVWGDPNTPTPIRAATASLIDMASAAKGGARWLSPFDMARVAMSAGAGAVSASLVGRTLGALSGLSPSAQQTLQRMGTWGGALTSLIPTMFGG